MCQDWRVQRLWERVGFPVIFVCSKTKCCQTAAEMQWKQMAAQSAACHSRSKRRGFKSSVHNSLEWAVVWPYLLKGCQVNFLESAYKHCACQVRWYIQPRFWWLNENWWTCKTSNLQLLLIPLISGIIIYRSHGSGEQSPLHCVHSSKSANLSSQGGWQFMLYISPGMTRWSWTQAPQEFMGKRVRS